jgi:DNA-binding response OmpR family regulator
MPAPSTGKLSMQRSCSAPIGIIEDDRNIASLVETYLRKAGFETIVAHDGPTGLELVSRRQLGFVILDLMLPGADEWDICREIRKESDVPILILTARAEETDRIVGFSMGADDYVVKPFSPRELVERVKAILRRTGPRTNGGRNRLQYGPLALEPDQYRVTLGNDAVNLTLSEFKLLHALMSVPGRVFSRDELLAHLYRHGEAVVDRVIDVHIGKLRHKIERNPSRPQLIETVRGIGYRFVEPDER